MKRKLNYLERFSHGSRATYIGNNRLLVRIVVADRNIAYFVEADDKLLTPWFVAIGGYEEDLTKYYVRNLRPNSHCLDVGSNFGYFTCLMARFCPEGRVIGIEPDQIIFELAKDNLSINGFSEFSSVIHAAAADTDGQLTLYRRGLRSGNTSIISVNADFTEHMGEPPATPFTVRSVRVDSLLDRFGGRLDFMKVDVEGAEPLVIAGATETIQANPGLSIMMEWSPGQIQGAGFDVAAFLDQLRSLELQPFDINENALKPLSFERLATIDYRAGVLLTRATP